MGREEDETLIEGQGVNASDSVPEQEPPDAPPQDDHGPDGTEGTTGDEMAGLPDQKPGYPGQQRSVDTG